jgi:hypothetical protein
MPEARIAEFQTYNISQITKIVEKALTKLRLYLGTTPTGDDFNSLVLDLYDCFPPTVRPDALASSMMPYVGKEITGETIKQFSWLLAGNLKKLKEGIVVPPWTKQVEYEWCPVQIKRANPGFGYDDKLGCFYEYIILAGSPAGLSFVTFWSWQYIKFIARDMGFKVNRKKRFIISNSRELCNMQLYLLFDPLKSKEDKPISTKHFVTPGMLKANQEILKQRFRLVACPLDYTVLEQPCHSCPLGYDECLAACHPKTYYTNTCPRCRTPDSWFDPLGKGAICVECADKERGLIKLK